MYNSSLLISDAERLGISLTDEQLSRFETLSDLLVEQNKTMNLTAITDPDGIAVKHFADSISVLTAAELPQGSKVLDVGTGAGFPGVPVLIAADGVKVTLFDAVNKKLEFIRSLVSSLGLDADIVHIRAEEAGKMPEYREKFDFVTARAVAQLRILSEFCIPLVKVGGSFVSMKGSISEEEKVNGIAAFSKLGSELYDDIIYNIHNGDERNIIIAKKISHVSSKYPRNMGQISKKPL